jgi:hypothetical protein
MVAKPAKKVKGKVDKPEKESVEDRFFRAVQGMEKRLEARLKALEDKFFAFQCGAQAQMERDRQALVFERLADERPPALDESSDSSPQGALAESAGP